MSWGRLSIGLVLAGAAGVTLGYALASGNADWWWGGGTTLMAATLLILSAFYAPRQAKPAGEEAAPRLSATGKPSAAPLLGEMLLQRTLLNRSQLDWALAQQRGTSKRLGGILVEMRLITHADLSSVLAEQRAARDGRYLWRGA